MEFLLELMENHYNVDKSFIPDSVDKILFNEELMAILYRLLDKNEMILKMVTENRELGMRTFKVVMYNFCRSCENSHTDNVFFLAMSILIQLTQIK